ncbi:MAG TPA: hypothetical protein EYN66_03960, partial [Myxococcales bacterium]|nr:hypothetical protein [Myxococcales bacterium]
MAGTPSGSFPIATSDIFQAPAPESVPPASVPPASVPPPSVPPPTEPIKPSITHWMYSTHVVLCLMQSEFRLIIFSFSAASHLVIHSVLSFSGLQLDAWVQTASQDPSKSSPKSPSAVGYIASIPHDINALHSALSDKQDSSASSIAFLSSGGFSQPLKHSAVSELGSLGSSMHLVRVSHRVAQSLVPPVPVPPVPVPPVPVPPVPVPPMSVFPTAFVMHWKNSEHRLLCLMQSEYSWISFPLSLQLVIHSSLLVSGSQPVRWAQTASQDPSKSSPKSPSGVGIIA